MATTTSETQPERLSEKVQLRRSLPPSALRSALRKVNGLTQQDLARELGCDRVTIGRYERGERTPRGGALVRYVELLHTLSGAA